jgi:hypoxanthine phosphoribosyltransferase
VESPLSALPPRARTRNRIRIDQPDQLGPASRPPVRWRREIDRVLITRHEIARRVHELARDIERDYASRDLLLISILSGTVLFIADLVRHLDLPLRLDFLSISSYRDSTRPGPLALTRKARLDVRDREVLLVDDILDTGRTLSFALRQLRSLRPRSMRTCVLLEKTLPRRLRLRPDYVGFRIPNVFVVGYGLDHAERFRNLPFVGVLKD